MGLDRLARNRMAMLIVTTAHGYHEWASTIIPLSTIFIAGPRSVNLEVPEI